MWLTTKFKSISDFGPNLKNMHVSYITYRHAYTHTHTHTNSFELKIPREGYEMADPYVKLYLLPDPNKETKKKTKIAKRTLNPTYNETVR